MTAEEWLEPGEAGCRLLLHLPRPASATGPEPAAALLGMPTVAGLIPEVEGVDEAAVATLAARAGSAGRACLLLDAVERVAPLGAHGVHLSDWRRVGQARRELGTGWIIGASCGLSRHAAMVAGEAGADYVLFGRLGVRLDPVAERIEALVAWWAELFYVPCAVALGATPGTAGRFVEAGADFLVPTLGAGEQGEDAAGGIRRLAEHLAVTGGNRSSEA